MKIGTLKTSLMLLGLSVSRCFILAVPCQENDQLVSSASANWIPAIGLAITSFRRKEGCFDVVWPWLSRHTWLTQDVLMSSESGNHWGTADFGRVSLFVWKRASICFWNCVLSCHGRHEHKVMGFNWLCNCFKSCNHAYWLCSFKKWSACSAPGFFWEPLLHSAVI